MTTKLEGKDKLVKENPVSSTKGFKAQIKSKLVHKEYTGTSEKIWKFLNINHKEPARNQYYLRLTDFDNFVNNNYNLGVDQVLDKLESKKFFIINNNPNVNAKMKIPVDLYDFLGSYLQYLTNKRKRDGDKLAASTIHDHMITTRTFIETETEIEINDKKYDNKIKLPQIIKGTKLPLPRETILKLINGCVKPNQTRLKMILLLLSACGSRIGESLLLRLSDLHLDGLPHYGTEQPFYPYIYFRGETTKIGKSRTTLLTNEMAEQLRLWIRGKYAVRNRVEGTNDGKYRTVHHTPEKNPNDFVFINIDSSYNEKDAAYYAYNDILQRFHELLDDLKLNHRSSNGQHAITPHKIRMAVRTEISNLVTDKEFPDFYIGHDVDIYYNPTDKRYKEQFELCQSALTYLDQTAIIRSHGSLQTQIHSIEEDQIAVLNKRLAQMEKERAEDRKILSEMREVVTNKVNLRAFLNGQMKASEKMLVMFKKAYDDAKRENEVGSMKKLEQLIKFVKSQIENAPQVVE